MFIEPGKELGINEQAMVKLNHDQVAQTIAMAAQFSTIR